MLDSWVTEILADPITKLPSTGGQIGMTDGVIDARRYLKNTIGFSLWDEGQRFYEGWDKRTLEDYKAEIEGAAPVYDHIRMTGRVLDVGGGAGTVRHYLSSDVQFVSIDPFVDYKSGLPPAANRWPRNCSI